MNAHDPFDRRISDLLVGAAPANMPDYLEEVRARARAERQRSEWSFPRNWIPFDLPVLPGDSAGRLVWVAILVLLMAGLVIVGTVGSQPRIPPPFGLAANGLVVYDDGNHIVATDPEGTEARALTSGAGTDTRPSVSRDGRRVAFLREDGTATSLVVANMDGSGARELATTDSATGVAMIAEAPAWAPDSRRIAITVLDMASARPVAKIWIVDADDGGLTELLPPSLVSAQYPAWAPDGDRIAFLGEPSQEPGAFLYVSAPDGSDLIRLSERVSDAEVGYLQLPRWSPDGKHIAAHYGLAEDLDRDVLLIATESLHEEVIARTDKDEASPAFSPDGRRLAFWRSTTDWRWQVVVLDLADGSEVTLAPVSVAADSLAWTPDATGITALRCASTTDCELLLLDPTDPGGEPSVLAHVTPKSYGVSTDQAYWSQQRLAP